MDKTLEDHVCAAKCGKGCIGPHCFCEGYAGKAGANTLCLPKQLCAEACDATSRRALALAGTSDENARERDAGTEMRLEA